MKTLSAKIPSAKIPSAKIPSAKIPATPVSVLPASVKIKKKLVFHQIYHHFTISILFAARHLGFFEQISTESVVLVLSDYILGNFDRGKYIVATFLDLSKAFDTLNRSMIIRKLRCYGITGRTSDWIISCFS